MQYFYTITLTFLSPKYPETLSLFIYEIRPTLVRGTLKGLFVPRPVSDIVCDVLVGRLREDDVVQLKRQIFHAGVLLGVGSHVKRHGDVV